MSVGVLTRTAGAGVLGKLPCAGDFLRLGVAQPVATALDGWLERGLAALEADDADWRDTFARAPVWRFLVSPGATGRGAAAGVMAPSVDAAGRRFPCLALHPFDPWRPADVASALGWFDALEAALVAAVRGDTDAEPLRAAVEAAGAPEESDEGAVTLRRRSTPDGVFIDARAGDPRAAALAAVLESVAPSNRASLWWRHAGGRIRLVATEGLPQGTAFAALFRADDVDAATAG